MSYKKRNCLYCGAEYYPSGASQKSCCRDHAAKLKAGKPKPTPHKTDWKEIDRRCLEAGLSYGQMVMRGLL